MPTANVDQSRFALKAKPARGHRKIVGSFSIAVVEQVENT